MREMDRLLSTLFPIDGDLKLVDLKFFPGEESVTLSVFCEEAHSAFLQVDSGQAESLDHFPETLKRISVDRFLAHS